MCFFECDIINGIYVNKILNDDPSITKAMWYGNKLTVVYAIDWMLNALTFLKYLMIDIIPITIIDKKLGPRNPFHEKMDSLNL